MKNCLLKEIFHLYYSGRLFVAVFVFLLLFIGGEMLNFQAVKNNIDSLEISYEYHRKMGSDKERIDNLIYEEYEYSEIENGYGIKNPFGYYWNQICQKEYASSPNYAIQQSLENIISLAPILFTIIGAIYGSFDFKYGVNKTKISRDGKTSYFFSKQIVMISEAFGLCILSALFAFITSFVTRHLSTSALAGYSFDNVFVPKENTQYFLCILITVLVVLMFLEIGFCFAFICKTPSVPVIVVVLYWYVCPVLGKYEPRNLVSMLTGKHFLFYGWVVNKGFYNVNEFLCFLILFSITIGSFVLSYFVSQKRSSF